MEIAGSCRSSKFEVRNPKFETIRTANHEYSKKFECSPDKDLAAASSVITSGRSLRTPPDEPSHTLRQRWHRRELKSEELDRQCCWWHIAVLYIIRHTQQISPWSRQGGSGLQGGLSKPPNARTRGRVCDAHWLKHVNSYVWAARTNYVVAHARNVNVSGSGNPVGGRIRLKACDRLGPLIYTRQIYVGEFKVSHLPGSTAGQGLPVAVGACKDARAGQLVRKSYGSNARFQGLVRPWIQSGADHGGIIVVCEGHHHIGIILVGGSQWRNEARARDNRELKIVVSTSGR